MRNRIENPHAFPTTLPANWPGMSLRDYFAAQAMVAIIGTAELDGRTSPEECREKIACGAYLVADAMLKERSDS